MSYWQSILATTLVLFRGHWFGRDGTRDGNCALCGVTLTRKAVAVSGGWWYHRYGEVGRGRGDRHSWLLPGPNLIVVDSYDNLPDDAPYLKRLTCGRERLREAHT